MRPLQLPCGSICCTTCMCDWVKHTPTIDPLSCPCCPLSHSVQMSQLHPAPQVLMKLLDTLLITCLRCGGRVPATKHKDHIESGCKLPPQESVPETIEDLLSQPPCTPLAPLEKRAMQHSLLRLFSSSPPESQVLTVPTSGRVSSPAGNNNHIINNFFSPATYLGKSTKSGNHNNRCWPKDSFTSYEGSGDGTGRGVWRGLQQAATTGGEEVAT